MNLRGAGIMTRVALVVSALVVVPHVASAQCSGASCTVVITLPVNDRLRLDLNTSTTALGTPTLADFAAGGRIATADGPTATVKANRAYTLSVLGASPTFTYAGAATNPNKPRSDLTWAKATGAAPGNCAGVVSFPNDMGTAASLLTGGTGAPAIGVAAPSQKICYRTLWAFASAPPGTYTLAVTYTLSAP